MRGVARSDKQVKQVRALIADRLSDYEISRRTGIPRSTILNWRHGRGAAAPRPAREADRCERCGGIHSRDTVDRRAYSYLLGQYLGDGTVWGGKKGTWLLRIASDAQYGGIIEECCVAIETIRGRRPYVRYLTDKRLATLTSYWRAWPCLFPQHGPGKKHHRVIALEPWQEAIVAEQPEQFLRGLIHSDGWRGLNRVHVKGRDYEYPRYQFSNRSQDIKDLFTSACELLGIDWRRWGRHHISVARRDSVARMDEFIGPKT